MKHPYTCITKCYEYTVTCTYNAMHIYTYMYAMHVYICAWHCTKELDVFIIIVHVWRGKATVYYESRLHMNNTVQ